MDPRYEKLRKCYNSFRSRLDFRPRVAMVLGSGLGAFAEDIRQEAVLDFSELEGFPVSTVPGHKGRFVFGWAGEVPVVIMQGRVHYYEGYPISDVVLPVRLMKLMGAGLLLLTNASGGVNPDFQSGDFMLIRDQISDFVPSPLLGPNLEECGTRFPDMSEIYDRKLSQVILDCAAAEKIRMREGVYIQLTGPQFETPAEVRMCRILGADAVGMSTACEAIAARHMGMRICGISCVSNPGAGISPHPLSHREVLETLDARGPVFRRLLQGSIPALDAAMRQTEETE